MKDWLAMIFWGGLLVVVSVLGGALVLLFIGAVMAMLALPIILIIWAIGAFL